MLTATNYDWRSVRARTVAYAQARPGLAQAPATQAAGRAIDMRPYWKATACQRLAGQPEPLVRAGEFAAVLGQMHLVVYLGEKIAGSRSGLTVDELPSDVTEMDYTAAVKACAERGQRNFWAGWDHTLADYPTLLAEGLSGLRQRIESSLGRHSLPAEVTTLQAMRQCVLAVSDFARRYAKACRVAGSLENAEILERIAEAPPTGLREAMQLIWLIQIAFVTEGRGHQALGRIDQYLRPFYERDMAAGRLNREEALDLFCHLWVKVAELGEVTNICIGGLTPAGSDATNELSYLALEATAMVMSPHTNLSARFHDRTPETFHRACFRCIRTGVGFPAIFNDEVTVTGLIDIGIPPEIARDYCMVGCIETMLAGRQPAWSDSRFNPPVFLLRALTRGEAEGATTYERLTELFREELRAGLRTHAESINAHIRQYPVERFPDPFLSALTSDCIARALDLNAGGAEFPRFHGIAIMGLAVIADSLAALKKLVWEEKRVTLREICKALANDFAGHEPLRKMLLNGAPKYGNGDAYVDDIAAEFVSFTADECLRLRLSDGGRFISAMAANVQNITAGKEVGATPDGRKAGTPLSDAASPYFGRDQKGPTALVESLGRPNYRHVLTGSVVNIKFEPEHFQGEIGEERFLAFTKTFVAKRIQQMQFNFTGARKLREAQEDPENHSDLVVRVSGFSAFFTRLDREIQEDVIRRRAYY